ncbi:hypothetical protein J416_01564 [Gracilibacillus halophilus YIM-C55.5]|uniref:Aminotransferase class I/classII large domain-containing protein n=1 Tax=Gracilibacillus halophilus YIM-C55.5 TaxID=1308866 RepID=N4WCY5_9BACI|nr:PLP-dependent aminotransferase family protein [Gracilibacillus halophilus]ENH98143.1 hypothetical protein J416_01564 [Gracilibacillus halophilus YIM-C55.5]
MNIDQLFSSTTKKALQNDPPGEWMPNIPANCLRLSSGFPAPNVVPVTELKQAVTNLLDQEQDLPLHYVGTPKMELLPEQIKHRLEQRALSFSSDEILVTAGACQAIDLIARVLLDEQSVVAVESPTYMEALEMFQNYTHQFIEIPMDEHGMKTDELAHVLAERKEQGLPMPKLLYTIPSFQNPTGTTLTNERRRHLIKLSEHYQFLILEDDAYGELYFDELPIPLSAMDTENRVLYVGSLSKVIAPGLRIGWVATTKEMVQTLFWFKKDLDHPFAQAIMSQYLNENPLDRRLKELRTAYKEKCDTMLEALEQYMPRHVSWYVPEGGYFVWLKISNIDTSALLDDATKNGVSFLPGKYFFLHEEEGREWLRLSFSYEEKEEIQQGIKRLSEVLSQM